MSTAWLTGHTSVSHVQIDIYFPFEAFERQRPDKGHDMGILLGILSPSKGVESKDIRRKGKGNGKGKDMDLGILIIIRGRWTILAKWRDAVLLGTWNSEM